MVMVFAMSIAISLLTLGVVMLLMTRVVASGGLERNSAWGIRTRSTRRSDQAWAAGHRAAQPINRLFVIAAFFFAVIVVALGFTKSMLVVGVTAVVAYSIVFILLGLAVHRANTAARAES